MARGLLLVATLVALVGLGAGQSRGSGAAPRNGVIAYAHYDETGRRVDIYTTNMAGTQVRRLTRGRKFKSFAPSFSPNGKRIAFTRYSTRYDLWTMRANGTRQRRLTWTKRIEELAPSWSPDGKQIAFVVASRDELEGGTHTSPKDGLWAVGSDGRGRHRLTHGLDGRASWSPDGSELAFTRFDPDTETDGIYIVAATGGTPTRLSAPGQLGGASDFGPPAWSPDGSRILFASDRPDTFGSELWLMNPDGSGVQQVTSFDDDFSSFSPAWSPDGQWIAYTGADQHSYQIFVSRADGSGVRILPHDCGVCSHINDDPSWQPLP